VEGKPRFFELARICPSLEREREMNLFISEGEDFWGNEVLLSTALI
jgi:hypothetical protein